ncbi:acyl-CoA dehydratase activase [Enterococcus sp. AZ192]|uniref:acyl-CoA dehydratase activase n=1 Tax=unclassified Enterococcus TaxID=2608891 RepID=UPI003D2C508D
MRVIGLDSGSTTTKGVLFEHGKLQKKKLVSTSGDPKVASEKIFTELGNTPETFIVTTGYGRKLIQADKIVTEITCHAKGAAYLRDGIKNVIDIGGQDSKAIRMDQFGRVLDFSMNDKCAAGTGRFVEVLMRTLGEKIEQIDPFVAHAVPVKINSMCTVFAESEVISLIGKGEKRENIALGVLHSIASRISNQLRQVNPETGPIFFSGGLSHSQTMAKLIGQYTKMAVYYDQELSQYAGAIGAAQIVLQQN